MIAQKKRMLLWLLPAAVYVGFCAWYTNLGGALTPQEIEHYTSILESNGSNPERIHRLLSFMEQDNGDQFIMVNVLDMEANPPTLPATGPDASADQLMAHYMEHMYRELFIRACHPIFRGTAILRSMDVVGIDGAEIWTGVSLMRYRSRRDLLEIASNPAFSDRHAYKVAALHKTIAYPVATNLYLSDPRLLLALVFVAFTALIDIFLSRPRVS